jgi:hypothetical protein
MRMRSRKTVTYIIVLAVLVLAHVSILTSADSLMAAPVTTATEEQFPCNEFGCWNFCEMFCLTDPEGPGTFCDYAWFAGGKTSFCDYGTCYFLCEESEELWIVCCEIIEMD